MTRIRLQNITQRYGETVAVSDINLEIGAGELFFLLGPSGCGKSTLLRLIAGLQSPSSGRIELDGRDVTSVSTQQRNAVMCFQGYALWPHMTVRENIRFGLSVRGGRGADEDALVDEALELIRMTGPLADRKPQQLSGGQQQRVALARAIAVKPACLLLDEPLSNLDTDLRQELRREIRRICKESGITTVYVTHDQEEALSTADRIAVMKDGRLAQVGTPRDLYQKPSSAFVARFVGPTNLIEGEVMPSDDGLTHVATPVGRLVATGVRHQASVRHQGAVVISIRPELIRISPVRPGESGGLGGGAGGVAGGRDAGGGGGLDAGGGGAINRLTGTLNDSSFLGQSSEHVIAVAMGLLRVMSAPPLFGLTGEVVVEFDPADVVVLPR